MALWLPFDLKRRGFLGGSLLAAGAAALCGGRALSQADQAPSPHQAHQLAAPGGSQYEAHANAHGDMITVGDVDYARNGFDPTAMLTQWETGEVTTMADGRKLRTFQVTAEDKEIEIAPGVMFPAWTFNGRVPGPALRATEGDRVRIVFKNFGSHPHSMHFHGFHAARMDGIPGAGLVPPGGEFVYEFEARPFGCHLYHCHALPLARHIHKGMYGIFVIDPDPAQHPEAAAAASSRLLGTPENAHWQEMAMVMNAFDTNFDGENEFYACNTIAHCYAKQPIKVVRSRPVRIYLVNVTEFDPINSFHLHGNFFDYYDQGTTLTPTLKTVDIIMQCQAQRGILEFTFGAHAEHEPGQYMFHAHQSEFTELGWMGMFDVVETLS